MQQQKSLKDLEKRYKELLVIETSQQIEDEIRAARAINPVKTTNTTYHTKSQVGKRIDMFQNTYNSREYQQPSINSKQSGGGRHEDFVESLLKPRHRLQWLLYNSKVLYPSEKQRPEDVEAINKYQNMISFTQYYNPPFIRGSSNQMFQDLKRLGILSDVNHNADTEMHVAHPETKCDELQYTIDRLVKEATKLKAINATQFCHKLPEKVRDTLRNEAKNRVEKNVTSKAKIREVRQYISKQRKAREAEDATRARRRNQGMQPPQAVRRVNNGRKDNTKTNDSTKE